MKDENPAEQPSCEEIIQRSQKMIQETRVAVENAERLLARVDTSLQQDLALVGVTVEQLHALVSLLPESVQKKLMDNPLQVLEERLQDTQQDTADDALFGKFVRQYLLEQPYIQTSYTVHPTKDPTVFLPRSRPKRWM